MKKISVRTMVVMALLISLSIVLTRFLAIQFLPYARFSLGSLPIYLAGLLLGPLAGGLTGAIADMIGATLFSSGYYPPLTIPPVLIGVAAGLIRPLLLKHLRLAKVIVFTLSTDLIINGLLGSIILGQLVGSPWITLLPVRLPMELVKAIAEGFLIFILYRRLNQAMDGTGDVAAR